MSLHSTRSKSLFADRVADVGEQQQTANRLHQQAVDLLSGPEGLAFGPRSTGADASANIAKGNEIVASNELAHAAEGGAKGLNLSQDNYANLLEFNPAADLYKGMLENHQQAAVDLAVKDSRFEQAIMGSDNLAAKDEYNLRTRGQPVAA
jgi:hypothetical protein